MSTNTELREMSDEQLIATSNEASQTLFRLRFQSQSERLNTPSEIRKIAVSSQGSRRSSVSERLLRTSRGSKGTYLVLGALSR